MKTDMIKSFNLELNKKEKTSIENMKKMNVLKPMAMATIALNLISFVQAGPTGQSIVIDPTDVTAKQGDHIKLECVVANMKGKCQWTKDGVGLGVGPTLPGFHRISIDERQARRRQLPSEHIASAH